MLTLDMLTPDQIPTPAGYRRLAWADARQGAQVWLLSLAQGDDGLLHPSAAGPFTVVGDRRLEAAGGRAVGEIGERLLVREGGE